MFIIVLVLLLLPSDFAFFIRQKRNKQKNRDNSIQSPPSPYICYSFTHTHRSIGYRNHNPQSLGESTVRLMYLLVYDIRASSRLMYLRVYDNRDSSYKSKKVLWFLVSLVRPTVVRTLSDTHLYIFSLSLTLPLIIIVIIKKLTDTFCLSHPSLRFIRYNKQQKLTHKILALCISQNRHLLPSSG